MEANGHDTICSVECFLYTIAVVDVYVNVEHTRMIPYALGRACFELFSEKATKLTGAIPVCRARYLRD